MMTTLLERFRTSGAQNLRTRLVAWSGLKFYEKLYTVSLAVFVSAIVCNLVLPPGAQVSQILAVVSTHGLLGGFVAWLWPALKTRWDTSQGVVAKAILHFIAFLVATMAARNQVSLAMGLPAQDFDLTVSFVAVFMYLPAWALILAALLTPAYMFALPLLLLGATVKQDWRKHRILTGIGHMLGAITLAFYAGQVFHVSTQTAPIVRNLIRSVALFADFQPAVNYPDIKAGERIRLHENGIISSARMHSDGVEVCVFDRERLADVRCDR